MWLTRATVYSSAPSVAAMKSIQRAFAHPQCFTALWRGFIMFPARGGVASRRVEGEFKRSGCRLRRDSCRRTPGRGGTQRPLRGGRMEPVRGGLRRTPGLCAHDVRLDERGAVDRMD